MQGLGLGKLPTIVARAGFLTSEWGKAAKCCESTRSVSAHQCLIFGNDMCWFADRKVRGLMGKAGEQGHLAQGGNDRIKRANLPFPGFLLQEKKYPLVI